MPPFPSPCFIFFSAANSNGAPEHHAPFFTHILNICAVATPPQAIEEEQWKNKNNNHLSWYVMVGRKLLVFYKLFTCKCYGLCGC